MILMARNHFISSFAVRGYLADSVFPNCTADALSSFRLTTAISSTKKKMMSTLLVYTHGASGITANSICYSVFVKSLNQRRGARFSP